MRADFLLAAAAFASCVAARQVVIVVGGNITTDIGSVFTPQSATANAGDVVVFNFTQGNHTATQSTFASPCVPAHITDSTINGFDSAFRDTVNGSAVTQLTVPISDNTTTIWFFDFNTCSIGGVGGINVNSSSNQTLDGFVRNAERLNGTNDSTTSSLSSQSRSATPTSPTSAPSQTATSSANQAVVMGLYSVIPAFVVLLAASL
ncbi:hypothetical protein CPB84DRAFT_1722805 [Gymnopilus junonius]|uniref:Uncharacterized protein n=1 Tax=Gymnopilus junonius TaxID=109634 RepID=A0A9P5TUH9_GYMJU|nr:hypothetical protein CPB84DRAFT_1722805 [Gymnopilus junonius]